MVFCWWLLLGSIVRCVVVVVGVAVVLALTHLHNLVPTCGCKIGFTGAGVVEWKT